MLETIGRMIGPTSVAVDTAMFLSSLVGRDVPGYEDMTSLQKVGKFIRQGVPAAAAVHRGLFGIAATAISDRPPELQNARDAMYRWEQMNGPASTPDPRQPDQIQWLDAMREVTKSVEKGGNWGDNELMDAMEKASIFGKDKNSIAESLRAKEVFKGPLDPRSRKSFDQAKYDSLVSYLGPQHTATLEAFDATLEYLAKRWVARHSGK
jgi:hypothetical protein